MDIQGHKTAFQQSLLSGAFRYNPDTTLFYKHRGNTGLKHIKFPSKMASRFISFRYATVSCAEEREESNFLP
jgi:hypothetical protein